MFETSDFGVSETGIHLLRSRFNYETVKFSDISKAEIVKGKELNNWWVIFLFGVLLLSFSHSIIEATYEYFMKPSGIIYIEQIALPIIPTIFGVYCIYVSLQNGFVLKFQSYGGRNYKYPLRSFIKDGKFDDFRIFMKSKVKVNFTFELPG